MERILSVKSSKWFKAVVVILLSCAFVGAGAWIALANADEKSEDLSFMSVHLMVTKDGTSNVTQASDLVGQLSTNVSYEEQADGSYLVTGIPSYNAKGTVPSEIKVVMSGVNTSGSSGATYGEDITSKCTIVDKAQAKILIPAEYVKNVKISEGVPTLYITYNGSKDFPEFYTETYVSVTIDGNEVSLPVSKNADTTNAGQTSDHTIDDHSNYKFMSNISFTPGTSEVVEDANLENLPYNVSSLFNGDDNYMDYDIKSVDVYTTNVASFDASNFHKLDNSNNQFYSVDTTRNIVTGLSNVFCKRIAVHVEAETEDILNNIVDPQLQGSVSSTSFSLKKVSGEVKTNFLIFITALTFFL